MGMMVLVWYIKRTCATLGTVSSDKQDDLVAAGLPQALPATPYLIPCSAETAPEHNRKHLHAAAHIDNLTLVQNLRP